MNKTETINRLAVLFGKSLGLGADRIQIDERDARASQAKAETQP